MTPISLEPEKVTKTVCSLHNYLREQTVSRSIYMPHGSVDGEDSDTHALIPGEWRSEGNPQGWVTLARQGSIQLQPKRYVTICVTTFFRVSVKYRGNTT